MAIGASVITGTFGCTISLGAAGAQRTTLTPSSPAPSSTVDTVKATFTAAITAVTSFGSPPAAYGMTVLSAIATRQAVPGFSATLVSDLETSGKAAIARYFGPRQAAAERKALASAMAFDAGPRVINLGSGVTRVSFGKVELEGALATVSAEVTAWRRSEARQPRTGSWLTDASVRVTRYAATLSRSMGGSWQVTRLLATATATHPRTAAS
ncbi:MAG TPA: hypothetical protein VMG38_14840 [Trebonia sp.]|nr:hypothetical protein [Trebonia sp.]